MRRERPARCNLDGSGTNLPKTLCTDGWVLRTKFPLGAQEPVPAPIDLEPILRGFLGDDYYIWRDPTRRRSSYPPARTPNWIGAIRG
jgi:hypothetical protein